MVNKTLQAEQQRRASERFYGRLAARSAAGKEVKPTARRLNFIEPSDGLALERIMGKSDLVGINYLELGLLASRPVCRIQIINTYGRTEGYGTGFLVGPNLLLTNNHVLERPELAVKSFAEFDFEEDASSRRKASRTFDLLPGDLFVTSPDLDYTLVAVAAKAGDGTPLSNFGMLPLLEESGKIVRGEYVSIIQHPEGGLKQCCLRENEVIEVFDDWLHYLTDTQPGSSGSPVFNDQWLVVSLHHSGVPKTDAKGKILRVDGQPYREGVDHPSTIAWAANEGVRVSRIFQDLEARKAGDRMAEEALIRLRSPKTGSQGIGIVVSPTPSGGLADASELAIEHFNSARGYDAAFLGNENKLPIPALAERLRSKVARLRDGGEELTYHHFSVVMNAERKLAFFTAVNIDGRTLVPVKRDADKWYFDPRLDKQFQAGPELYNNNPLDKGHLVRRLDPCWGNVAVQAGEDTFHYTNCSPQHSRLNQHDWLEVENFVINTAENADARISVFTGPVFREDDMPYRVKYQLPADFWKVVAFVNKNGKLRATAYLRSQKNYIESMEFFDDEYKTWQVPVAQVEALTGISFGIPAQADPMAKGGVRLEAQRRYTRQIRFPSDILL